MDLKRLFTLIKSLSQIIPSLYTGRKLAGHDRIICWEECSSCVRYNQVSVTVTDIPPEVGTGTSRRYRCSSRYKLELLNPEYPIVDSPTKAK